jgi:hypothetical protein
VYICFGIFFIAGLSKGSLILRYLWKTKFRGKLSLACADSSAFTLGVFQAMQNRVRRSSLAGMVLIVRPNQVSSTDLICILLPDAML